MSSEIKKVELTDVSFPSGFRSFQGGGSKHYSYLSAWAVCHVFVTTGDDDRVERRDIIVTRDRGLQAYRKRTLR